MEPKLEHEPLGDILVPAAIWRASRKTPDELSRSRFWRLIETEEPKLRDWSQKSRESWRKIVFRPNFRSIQVFSAEHATNAFVALILMEWIKRGIFAEDQVKITAPYFITVPARMHEAVRVEAYLSKPEQAVEKAEPKPTNQNKLILPHVVPSVQR